MRFLSLLLLAILLASGASAQTSWMHNGSVVQLSGGDGTNEDYREIVYLTPRRGLSVGEGTVLFQGSADGGRYSGTAYVFSSRCGPAAYEVSGGTSPGTRSITLRGRAPARLDDSCNVTSYRDDVLVFTFVGISGCDGAFTTPEIFWACRFNDCAKEAQWFKESGIPGASCPYLYAWNEQSQSWESYGKVIRDAISVEKKMTETVRLTSLATSFRLAEHEPEQSYIEKLRLVLHLKNGGEVSLEPQIKPGSALGRSYLHIPAFSHEDFSFKLPQSLNVEDIERAALSITGYYEILWQCPVPPRKSRK